MANLTLETAFQRLSIRPAMLCRQCRRSFVSTSRRKDSTTSLLNSLDAPPRTPPLRSAPATTATATPTAAKAAETLNPRSTNSPSPTQSSYEAASAFIQASTNRKAASAQQLTSLQSDFTRVDLERQQSRRFKPGEIYAPHDLSATEAAKFKKPRRPGSKANTWDVVDQLGVKPMDLYKNFTVMSEFVTEMGRIRGRSLTGLRKVNQRRMAKAVRRAIGVGLMPGVHRHPELLKKEREAEVRARSYRQ